MASAVTVSAADCCPGVAAPSPVVEGGASGNVSGVVAELAGEQCPAHIQATASCHQTSERTHDLCLS